MDGRKAEEATVQKKRKLYKSLPQILAVSIKNILLFGYGMTLGFPTIVIPTLQGTDPNESLILTSEQISWIGSINLITVPFGCLLSGIVTQPLGRKLSMQLVNIPFVIAWILFHVADRVEYLYTALFLTGLGGGLLEAPVLTYVAEVTQPYLRGILSATSSMSVIFGVFTQFLFGSFLPWRTVALINFTIPILAILLLFFIPESPHWLIYKGRLKQAQESLAWLRGWTQVENVETEFRELHENLTKKHKQTEQQSNDITKQLKRFTSNSFVRPYCLISLAFLLTHFTGMSTLQTYAVQIFDTLNAPIGKYYATLLLGVAELVGSLLCVMSVHHVGKRPLTLISITGGGVCFLIVAVYAYTNGVKYFTSGLTEHVDNPQWLPMTFLIGYALLSHLSIRLLPWILIGEVYPSDIRAMASGLSSGTAYIFGFLANKSFLFMVQELTLPGVFWFHCAVSFIGTILIYFFLPETEGRTLHEIEMHFDGTQRIKRNAGVFRKQKINNNIEFTGHVNQAFTEPSDLHHKEESKL